MDLRELLQGSGRDETPALSYLRARGVFETSSDEIKCAKMRYGNVCGRRMYEGTPNEKPAWR